VAPAHSNESNWPRAARSPALDLARDEQGFVRVEPRNRVSSVPGVHVVGDAITMLQAAIVASSDGMAAAAAINHELIFERLARTSAGRSAR
jgi:pyruvate/2-oxoglutarate dehydrogenase complex dihydrolipoamide dehydrogenase (E3) component